MNGISRFFSAENVLSYGLGFVAAWFGLNEIFAPQEWVTFAPPFVGDGTLAVSLVILHGIVLASCALLLFLGLYGRFAAAVLALIFVEVILGLVTHTGLAPDDGRDTGLFGMSLGLTLLSTQR